MTAAKHTPGPWHLFAMETGWYVNQQGGPGYVGTLHRVSHRAEECEANARLIAAAPELLEALQAVTWVLDMALCTDLLPPGADGPATKARAAIAKALGGAL